jgi:hypothetical protein
MLIQASLSERARPELLAGPERTNAEISEATGASRGTVARVRQQLAAAGLVPHLPGSRLPVPGIPVLPAHGWMVRCAPSQMQTRALDQCPPS